MISISPFELLQWQLEHYARRLSEAKTIRERVWLRNELYHLKKKKQD